MFKVTMTMAMFVFMASQSVFAADVASLEVGSVCKQLDTKNFKNDGRPDITITKISDEVIATDFYSKNYKKISYSINGMDAGYLTDEYIFRSVGYVSKADSLNCDESANYMRGTGDAGITSCLSCSAPQ